MLPKLISFWDKLIPTNVNFFFCSDLRGNFRSKRKSKYRQQTKNYIFPICHIVNLLLRSFEGQGQRFWPLTQDYIIYRVIYNKQRIISFCMLISPVDKHETQAHPICTHLPPKNFRLLNYRHWWRLSILIAFPEKCLFL